VPAAAAPTLNSSRTRLGSCHPRGIGYEHRFVVYGTPVRLSSLFGEHYGSSTTPLSVRSYHRRPVGHSDCDCHVVLQPAAGRSGGANSRLHFCSLPGTI
jgi:hypothetical protein